MEGKYLFNSIPDLLMKNASVFKDEVAIIYKKDGKYITLTYNDLYYRALQVSRGLKKMGIKKGDRVAILSETRTMWVLADFGLLNIGAVEIPVYYTDSAEQIAYVLKHSEAKMIFVSNKAQYQKLLSVRDQIENIEFVIAHDRFLGDKKLPLITLFQLSEISEPLEEKDKLSIEQNIQTIQLNDMYTILYTSGTTGVPKGVLLTHGNIISNIYYTYKKVEHLLTKDDIFLTYLPYSHVLGKTDSCYLPLYFGAKIAFAESIEKIADNMKEVRPTVMITVPRLLEKMYSRIFDVVHTMPTYKKKMFHWAVGVGERYTQSKYIDKNKNNSYKFQYDLAYSLVFKKLKRALGLDRFKFFVSGGAPLDRSLNVFFWVCNLRVLEGYGLTETSPVVCVNTPDRLKFGSVGTLLEKTEVCVAEDGELMFRGPQIAKGYYKMENETKEAFLENGWFRTGDIGYIDQEKFIYITDRKKELIITAGGKNIAPQPIENALKFSKYVSNVCLYGDRKPYIIAIVTLDIERMLEFAKENKLRYFDVTDLSKNERVIELIKSEIEKINTKFAKAETIKKFVIIPHDFSIQGGELTSTLKLKRRIIYEKYMDSIECLYSEDGNCYTCAK